MGPEHQLPHWAGEAGGSAPLTTPGPQCAVQWKSHRCCQKGFWLCAMCPVLWLEEQPVPGALSLVPVGASAGSTWSWVIGSDKETGLWPWAPKQPTVVTLSVFAVGTSY